ncbi:restriction endonuclease subunit S [Janthinobacterium sp.]|uniref:restriction endonuclease subunit S n=1 Tax=Janthinobacterium sp. TaxID=1871054 RepID=UPI0025C2B710|nr:restriction endonuclease subunit S [Janthinobacterium sp.]NBV17448.1 restriction endonuclease subunit S [Janthinobacterium sp.]
MFNDAKKLNLKDVARIRGGHPFRGSVPVIANAPVAVVQMKDILPSGQIDWSSTVRTELVGRKEPDWLKPGDILFISRGNRYHAACVDQPPPLAVCGAHLFHLTVRDPDIVLPAFLAWQIGQPPVQRQLQQAASGSHQLSVARPALEALEIAVPSLKTQRLLVDLADMAQREKALLTAMIRNREQELEALAHAIAEGIPLNFS